MTTVRQTSSKRRDNERRNIIIKFAIMMTLGAVLVGIATIAWFAMNRDVDAGGVGMNVGTKPYIIKSPAGGNDGMFKTLYDQIDQGSDVVVWQMTSGSNLNNYDDVDNSKDSAVGIEPGDYGKLSFVVTPKTESVTLDFAFDVIGYSSSEVNGETVLTEVTTGNAKTYLNGHILFFEHCTNGIYSDPILLNEDMNRVLASQTFTGVDTDNTVDIYWIWPAHLSDLVEVSGSQLKVDTTSQDYSMIEDNINTYPQYYLANLSDEDLQEEDMVGKIQSKYSTYGDKYDEADTTIGSSINYILVRLNVANGD